MIFYASSMALLVAYLCRSFVLFLNFAQIACVTFTYPQHLYGVSLAYVDLLIMSHQHLISAILLSTQNFYVLTPYTITKYYRHTIPLTCQTHVDYMCKVGQWVSACYVGQQVDVLMDQNIRSSMGQVGQLGQCNIWVRKVGGWVRYVGLWDRQVRFVNGVGQVEHIDSITLAYLGTLLALHYQPTYNPNTCVLQRAWIYKVCCTREVKPHPRNALKTKIFGFLSLKKLKKLILRNIGHE